MFKVMAIGAKIKSALEIGGMNFFLYIINIYVCMLSLIYYYYISCVTEHTKIQFHVHKEEKAKGIRKILI